MTVAARQRTTSRQQLLPSQVSGLKLWLKADAIEGLADNDTVTSWADSSGVGNTMPRRGASTPTYKTNIRNGKPVVRFDGVDDAFQKTAAGTGMATTTFTVFVVATHTSATGSYAQAGDAQGGRQFVRDTNQSQIVRANQAVIATGTSTFSTGQWGIFACTCQNGAQAFYKTGFQPDGTDTVASPAFTDAAADVWVGCQGTGAQFLAGDLAEVCWYDRVLTTAELVGLYVGLGAKYAL